MAWRLQWVGWQPSRFLADRAKAQRALQLAERLDSVNAAASRARHHLAVAAQAFIRHGLGMSARNPDAVRQWTIVAAHQRRGNRLPGLGPGVRGPYPAPFRGGTACGRAA